MRKLMILIVIIMLFVVSCGSDDDNVSTVDNDAENIFIECIYNESNPDPCDNPDNTEFFPREYGGLHWSCLSENTMAWEDAKQYCKDKGGRLPMISELRSTILNCPNTELDGFCTLTDDCLDMDICDHDTCHEGCRDYPEATIFCKLCSSRPGFIVWSSSVGSDGVPFEMREGIISRVQDVNVWFDKTLCVQEK